MPDGDPDAPLVAALQLAADHGSIGERSLADAIAHSLRFLPAIPDAARQLVDLGSGGGLPGIVIAAARPDLFIRLVDRRAARTDVLRRIVVRLGLTDNVQVTTADVATLIDAPGWVGSADVVTARSFASPEVTAAIARRLLTPQGSLLVSAPPPGDERWNAMAGWARSAEHRGVVTLTPLPEG